MKKFLSDIKFHAQIFQQKTDSQLLDQSQQLLIRAQTTHLDTLASEWFALVQEVSFRNLGIRHFDTQFLAGFLLHQGKIVEMKTGEGKTLASTLPASLNALSRKGVHVVTVNDYLAKRDKNWMGKVYSGLGLSTGLIESNSSQKRKN
jgi:preprotein translocase subunit SecA